MVVEHVSPTDTDSALDTKHTVCYMCTTGFCPTDVTLSDGKPEEVDIFGVPCARGQAQIDFVTHPDRLKYPLRRAGERGSGKFERITWEEALDTIADALLKVKREHGPESIIFFSGYTKEPRPYWQRLGHAFGSPNFLSESSSCFSATYVASYLTFGKDHGEYARSARGMDPQSKVLVIWGANPSITSPPGVKAILAGKKNGVKLVVIDPRRTETAALADLHLQPRPGTDGALALGMMHVIIGEGLYDREFVAKWTVGFDDLRKLALEYPPERVEQITRVPAEKVRELALIYATNKPAKLHLSPCGTVHTSNGVQSFRAMLLLAAITGNIDVPGGNRLYSKGAPSNDISLFKERIDQLPPRVGQDRFPIWTKMYHEGQSNALADQIESGKPYPITALVGMGPNVMMWPNTTRMVKAWKQLDFIACNDFFHTPTTYLADIVLPAATYAESDALIFPSPWSPKAGVVRLREPFMAPVGESWPDWKFTFALAAKLDLEHEFWGGDLEKCFNYQLEPAGLTVEELRKHPLGFNTQPAPPEVRAYEKTGFSTPSGKVEIVSSMLVEHGFDGLPVYEEPKESPFSTPELTQKYPLVLMTGARVPAYTHSSFRRVKKLRNLVPDPMVDIHPDDAAPRGIQSGDDVQIETLRGKVVFKAKVTDSILPGVVSVPHGWAEANANLLTDDEGLDPISGFPPYKSQLCQATKVGV